jgi:hypothetical protein
MQNCKISVCFLQISYPESKQLNVTEFELIENRHFNNIRVNMTMSTVHVPTNIYDRCKFECFHWLHCIAYKLDGEIGICLCDYETDGEISA